MPRKADPRTRKVILEACETLLEKDSGEMVTMRAIAEMTGIAVTTVYERFGSREGLLRELTEFVAADEAARLQSCKTIEEVFERYLEYAREHPFRYKLMADSFMERLASGVPLPGLELVKQKLAEKLGGTPAQQDQLAIAVLELLAGTVTAILTASKYRKHQLMAKRAAIAGLDLILAAAAVRQKRK